MTEVDKKWNECWELFQQEPDSFNSLETLGNKFKASLDALVIAVREESARVCETLPYERGNVLQQCAKAIRALDLSGERTVERSKYSRLDRETMTIQDPGETP